MQIFPGRLIFKKINGSEKYCFSPTLLSQVSSVKISCVLPGLFAFFMFACLSFPQLCFYTLNSIHAGGALLTFRLEICLRFRPLEDVFKVYHLCLSGLTKLNEFSTLSRSPTCSLIFWSRNMIPTLLEFRLCNWR